jgi:hypothetical protein
VSAADSGRPGGQEKPTVDDERGVEPSADPVGAPTERGLADRQAPWRSGNGIVCG